MSCSNKGKKTCHDKSCQRYYNSVPQPFVADSTTNIIIAGAKVVDTGISIETHVIAVTAD